MVDALVDRVAIGVLGAHIDAPVRPTEVGSGVSWYDVDLRLCGGFGLGWRDLNDVIFFGGLTGS